MDHSFPTAADYAYSAANDAKRENERLSSRVRSLEDRVKYLENILSVRKPKKRFPFK